ncbi:MAG: hypothetical protein RLZ56_924 [Bacteroidota bacterium]
MDGFHFKVNRLVLNYTKVPIMSFSIEIQPIFDFKQIRIHDSNAQVTIDIISKGGLLNSWKQSPAQDNWDIIDGNHFEDGWNHFETNGFKGGKMNPFSCRLFKGSYQHAGKYYQFNKFYLGEHALHGLMYDAQFEIVATTIEANKASVHLSHQYHKKDAGFPFEYSIELIWTLWENNKISVQTILTNKDDQSFPMMDGWHPYFKLGASIDACSLQFNNKGILAYDASLIPTGALQPCTIFTQGEKLAGISLDNGYLLDSVQPSCTLSNHQYKLVVTPSAQYPFLQLYTPPSRKSIAIENLSGAPDCFNNKMGLHILQPQSIWHLETTYELFVL